MCLTAFRLCREKSKRTRKKDLKKEREYHVLKKWVKGATPAKETITWILIV